MCTGLGSASPIPSYAQQRQDLHWSLVALHQCKTAGKRVRWKERDLLPGCVTLHLREICTLDSELCWPKYLGVDQNTWETKFTTSERVASLCWYQQGEVSWEWWVSRHDEGLGSVPREDWMSCYAVFVLWTGDWNCKSCLLDKCQGLLHLKMMYAACWCRCSAHGICSYLALLMERVRYWQVWRVTNIVLSLEVSCKLVDLPLKNRCAYNLCGLSTPLPTGQPCSLLHGCNEAHYASLKATLRRP